MSTWLAGGRSDPRGLLIPGGPHGRSADLLLRPNAVEVVHGDSSATLEWGGYAAKRRYGVVSSWAFAFWGGSPQGIGIDGPSSLDALGAATSTVLTQVAGWNPFNRFATEHPVLPLWAIQHSPIWVLWQMSEIEGLVQLLADRPKLRPELLDPRRTAALAQGLTDQPNFTGAGFGVRSSDAAVAQALSALGYSFRYGRPLPGDKRDPLDVVLDKVMTHLRANAWGNARVDRDRATDIINKRYIQVSPWPFAALGV